MSYMKALAVLIEDRIDHLTVLRGDYSDDDKVLVDDEINSLEKCLDIIAPLE